MQEQSRRGAVVVRGVSGSGTSTSAKLLAERLDWTFIEGDSFHSAENQAKMHAGVALTGVDRLVWLTLLGHTLAQDRPAGVVLSCSALKLMYRKQLRACVPGLRFIWLAVAKNTAARRVAARGRDHFFPPVLINSQFQTLAPPDNDAFLLRDRKTVV